MYQYSPATLKLSPGRRAILRLSIEVHRRPLVFAAASHGTLAASVIVAAAAVVSAVYHLRRLMKAGHHMDALLLYERQGALPSCPIRADRPQGRG